MAGAVLQRGSGAHGAGALLERGGAPGGAGGSQGCCAGGRRQWRVERSKP